MMSATQHLVNNRRFGNKNTASETKVGLYIYNLIRYTVLHSPQEQQTSNRKQILQAYTLGALRKFQSLLYSNLPWSGDGNSPLRPNLSRRTRGNILPWTKKATKNKKAQGQRDRGTLIHSMMEQ